MSSIMKGLVDEQDIEETKKLSAKEKFKRSMARAGYDMDAGAKRLQDLLAQQKKEREELEKKEKEIKEGPAVDAYMAGKSPAIAHFADRLDNIKEDETLQFAAEITPKVSPYAGIKDRKFRGAIGEGIKQMFENPNESPTDAGYQQGGWRKMNEEEVDEDLRKWFKEKWVRFGPDGKIRGSCARGDDSEGKPKCLPQAKAHALGKKGRKYAAAKKRREDPNPERSGPAKNVATKKKSNESLREFAPNFRDDGDGDSRDIDRLREKIYNLLMKKLANVEGDPQDIAMAAMEVADDIASESEFVDFTKLPNWIKMVLNKVQGVAEANSPEEFLSQIRKLAGTKQKFKVGDWVVIDPNETSGYASSGMTGRITNLYNDEGEKMAEVAVGGASGIQKKMKLGGGVFGPKGMELDLGKGIRSAGTKTSVPLSLLQKFDTSMDEQGVAKGSEKNVVKSVKVGNFRHDLVDTGMGWQVRIYNGDELYDTGLSKNSEQKGLAALEDAVAYTEKQTRTKRQGVAEGTGFNQEAGIGLDGESFKFKIKDLVALANNYPVTPIDPRQFTQQIKGRNEDPTQSMARAEKADLQYPIIVVQRTNGKLWIADGTHRAHKAILNKIPKINAKIIPIKDMSSFFVKQGVAEGYTGRETKDGTWRVFKDGKAVAVAGPFKSREEAAAWIKKQKQGVAEGSKYPRNPASYHLKKYPVPPDQLARPIKKEPKKPVQKPEEQLDELKCWDGYTRVKGVPAGAPGSCKKKKTVKEDVVKDFLFKVAKQGRPGMITAILNSPQHPAHKTVDDIYLKAIEKGFNPRMDMARIEDFVMNGLKKMFGMPITERQQCPECGGNMYEVSLMNEKKDACYYKVKSRYKVWPSAYASGALVKCRKKGAKNWGTKTEGQIYSTGGGAGEAQRWYTPKDNLGETSSNILAGILKAKE